MVPKDRRKTGCILSMDRDARQPENVQ